jgi:uncharacterized protein (TIGR00725 family)
VSDRPGPPVAVVGPADAAAPELAIAEELGAGLAAAGFTVLTGGLGGVMEAASRGARSELGRTVGILPGTSRDDANGWVELAIATGMGEARNAVLVRSADAVVAIGGGHGTLSEIAFALKMQRPVIGLYTWDIPGVEPVTSAADAVTRVTQLTA